MPPVTISSFSFVNVPIFHQNHDRTGPKLALWASVLVQTQGSAIRPPHSKVTLHLKFPCFKSIPYAPGVCLPWLEVLNPIEAAGLERSWVKMGGDGGEELEIQTVSLNGSGPIIWGIPWGFAKMWVPLLLECCCFFLAELGNVCVHVHT